MDYQALLTVEEHEALTARERHNIGSYRARGSHRRECKFVIDMDARPLMVLAESAALGNRVYEFMSIRRPGDVLHYLWVKLTAVGDDVIAHMVEQKKAKDSYYRHFSHHMPPMTDIGFVECDSYFFLQDDDTYPFAEIWHSYRESGDWQRKADVLFEVVTRLQTRLRQKTDFLLQNELRLIDHLSHRGDYKAEIERRSDLTLGVNQQSELPDELFHAISNLVERDTVQSVSCPLTDFALWRLLVEQQMRRAQRLGMAPQEAFTLSGPDSGLPEVTAEDYWGGNVHIPYEGACEGDLFILPEWRVFRPEHAQDGGSLAAALNVPQCQYVLTSKDYGYLESATRSVIGDWILYESKMPYEPSDPLGLRRRKMLGRTR